MLTLTFGGGVGGASSSGGLGGGARDVARIMRRLAFRFSSSSWVWSYLGGGDSMKL